MPYYCFSNAETGETQDVFYHMADAPKIGSFVEIDGQQWRRELTTSQLAVAGLKPVDPFNAKDFVRKTGEMKGNLGDLWDASKELSQQRAAKEGVDVVKEKFYVDYSKKRRSTPHMSQLKEKQEAAMKTATEKMKALGISIKST